MRAKPSRNRAGPRRAARPPAPGTKLEGTMKTAATVILVIALIGMIPKKKKHEPPPAGAPAAGAVQARSCPEIMATDDSVHIERIFKHAKHLTRKRSVSEEQLRYISASIVKYARAYCIEPELGAALIARESAYNPNATSPSGACGLGQMLPSTASRMGASDCYDIDQNLNGAMRYFRQMLDMWQGHSDQVDRGLASYLVGPGAVKSHGGVPWGNSTCKRYIADIYSYRDTMLSY